MAYTKVWKAIQDSYPGYQDWNTIQDNEQDFRDMMDVAHGTAPAGPGQPTGVDIFGRHDALEIPLAAVHVKIQAVGAQAVPTMDAKTRTLTGVERAGVGEYVLYAEGLSSDTRAEVLCESTDIGVVRKAEVYFVAGSGEGSISAFLVSLTEWDGAAWDSADFGFTLVAYSP